MTPRLRTPRSLCQLAASFLMLLLLASPALADEVLPNPSTPEALAKLEEGNKHYMLREYEQAIATYKEGVALEPKTTVTFWYNLGQANRQWGKYEAAIWFYSQFLKAAPTSLTLHRHAAEDFIAKMRSELEKAASTAGPTEPGPAPLNDTNVPAPTDSAATEPRPTAGPIAIAPRWYEDRLGWILAGAGVAATATGAGFLASGASLEDQANGEPRSSERRRLRDSSSSRVTVGVIAGGAGVALLTAGIIKLALTPGATEERAVQVTVTPRWIGLQGRF